MIMPLLTLVALVIGCAVKTPGTTTESSTFTVTAKGMAFDAPTTPGMYFFHCDIHPATMTGQFIVK
ncbi:MAG: hypothetical protein ABFD13_04555 [Candidatus Cryosericum sp.]